MATNRHGRTVQYMDAGFGFAVCHVFGANAVDDGERAFTLSWKGDAPGEARAIEITNSMPPGWWVEPAPEAQDGGGP